MATELIDNVRMVTGSHATSVPATTDAQLLEFLNLGCRYATYSLPLELVHAFATDSSAITDNSGQAVITDRIIGVRRNDRECRRIDKSLMYAQELTKTFTITVSDYANIAAGHAFTINGVKFYMRAAATGEEADFKAETGNSETAANIEDVIDATFSVLVSSSSSAAVVTVSGADSVTSEDSTRLAVAETASTLSLHKLTDIFPGYIIKANKVYIKPDPTASAVGYITYIAAQLLLVAQCDRDDLTVPGLEGVIVNYAIAMDFVHISHVWRDLAQTNLDKIVNASTGYLADFEGALPTYSDPANPSMPTLVLATMTALPSLSLSSATDTWPTFSETITLPTLVLPVMTDLPSEGMGAITITSPGTLSMPTAPTLPTLVLASMDSLQAALSEANIDFSDATVPIYSQPSIGTAIGTLSITNKTLTDPGTLTLPTGIVLPALALTSAPSFSDLILPVAPVKTLTYTSAGDEPEDAIIMTETLPTFVLPVSGVDLSTFDTRLTAADVELASTEIQKQMALVQEYQANIQKELNRFNAEMNEYRAELEKEVAEARADVAAYTAKMQDNRNDLDEQVQQYQGDLGKYQQAVNAAVQEWTSEEVQFKLAKWQGQVQSEIQEYSAKVQAVIGDYRETAGAKINEFRANLERQVQEFKAEMEADVSEWNTQKQADLSKFQADIQEAVQSYSSEIQHYTADLRKLIDQYTAESTSDVSKYQANVQKLLEKFTRQNTANIQEYQAVSGAVLNKYAQEIQDNVQEFNANVTYRIQEAQFNLNREVQEFQLQSNIFINKYQALATSEIQSFSAEVTSVIGEYNAIAGSYAGRVQAYLGELNALRNSEIAEYQQKVQAYVQEYSTKNTSLIGEFTANVQKESGLYAGLVQGEVSEFSAGMQKANSYLAEINAAMGAINMYRTKSKDSFDNSLQYYKLADKELKEYITKNLPERKD